MTTLDDLDRVVLERMWPHLKYSDKWRWNWWCRVGHTVNMRLGLVALRVGRGPRGLVLRAGGRVVARSTVSGEIG